MRVFPSVLSFRVCAVTSCFAIVCTLAGCASTQRYIDRGNGLYAAGKYEEATLEYRNAIKKSAQSGEAYYRLGLAELKLNSGNEAYDAFTRAVTLSPENLDAKQRLAELCLKLYTATSSRPATLYTQARALTDELLSKNPNSPDALHVKAAIALIDNKPDQAVDAMQRALRASPDSEVLESDLADALLHDNRIEEGERTARDVIQNHPQYNPAYELLYAQYQSQHRDADLLALLSSWKANNPNDPTPFLRLAAYYNKQQKSSDAENILAELLQRRATIPRVDLIVGDFHAGIGNREKALADYERGQSLDPTHTRDYQERVANALAALGRREEALKTLESILASDYQNRFARALKTELLTSLGGAQNLNAAGALASDLAKEAPRDPSVQMIAGQALAAKGDLASAAVCFQRAAAAAPAFIGARLALARLAAARKDYQSLVENSAAALAINPADPDARLLHVMGLTETGAYAQAKTEADQLARDIGNKAPVETQLGLIALHQRNYQEAQRHLETAYRTGNSDSTVLAGLVGTYIGEHQPDKALQLTEEDLRRSPQSSSDAALLVASAQAGGKPDTALADLQKLAAQNPKSVEIQVQIGILQQKRGNLAAALEAFQRASELAPQRADFLAAIADIQEVQGQKTEAIANYRKALSLKPDDPGILNNLAFTLADAHGDLNEALNLATTASRKSPDSPSIQDTLAWIHIQRGESAAMIPVLAQLTRKYPSNAAYRYHYAVALFQKGDRASAKQQLEMALSNGPGKSTESAINALLGQLR